MHEVSTTILIVDDNPAGLYVKSRLLQRQGYRIIEASTGQQALDMAVAAQPDLLILDVNLPDIDGFDVCLDLKRQPRTAHAKILHTSAARIDVLDRMKALECGADAYLVEPAEEEEILGTVRALLKLAEQERENHRLLNRLSRTERQLREASEAANCGMWDWDIPSSGLAWFGAHERLAGLRPGSFSGKVEVFNVILHPDDRLRVWQKLEALMARREYHYADDYRFVHPDGSVYWMTATGRFFYDDAGTPVRMTGVVQDVTERKRAEEQLRSSEARLVAMFQQTTAGIAQTDAVGQFLLVNDRYCEIVGRSREALLALRMQDITHPDDLRVNTEKFQAALRGGTSFTIEKRYVRPDGSVVWVRNDVSAIQDAGGTLFMLAVVADITERKRAEEALRVQGAHLQRLYDLTSAVNRAADVPELYALALDALEAVLGADRAAILLFDEAGGMRFEAWRGLSDDYRRAVEGHCPWLAGEAGAEPIGIDDVSAADLEASLKRIILQEGIRALVFIPLRYGGGVIGKFMLYYDAPRRMEVEEMNLAQSIADQLASGIERRRAEAKLRASEAFARHLSDVAPSILYIYDLVEKRNVWGNREMVTSLGYSLDDLAGMSGQLIETLMHPDDLTSYGDHLTRVLALADGDTAELEYRFRHKNGSWMWIHSRDMVFRREADGRPRQIVGAASDITARKQAEETLRASQARLAAIFDQSTVGIAQVDLTGRFVLLNDRFCRLVGRTRPHLLTLRMQEITHPDDLPANVERFHALSSGAVKSFVVEKRYVRPDGSLVWVHNEVAAIRDGHDRVVYATAMVVDITERKVTDDRMREQQDLISRQFAELQAVYQSVPVGLASVDRELRFMHINEQLAAINGWPAETHIGRTLREILPQDLVEQVEPLYREVLDRGRPVINLEVSGETAGGPGTVRNWLVNYYPLQNGDQDIVGVNVMVQDVTDRKQAEARQALLMDVSRLVLECQDAEGLLTDAVFRKIRAHLDADVCFNYRLASDGRSLELVAGVGIPLAMRDAAQRLEVGQAFCGTVAGTCRPLTADVDRIAQDDKGAFVRAMGVRAYACHPLFTHDQKVLGTLSFASTRRDSFSVEDVEFLQTICHFVAIAWERRAAVESLRRSERRFRAIFDHQFQFSALLTPEERVVEVSESPLRLSGFSREDIIGRPFLDTPWWSRLPAVQEQWRRQFAEALARPGPSRAEAAFETADGAMRYALNTATALRNERGEVEYLLVEGIDITDRKQAETELRESEERLRLALESADLGSWDIDMRTGATVWNRRHAQMQGYTFDDGPASIQRWQDRVHRDDRARVMAAVERAKLECRLFAEEHRILRADTGELRWLCLYGRFSYDEQGEPIRFSGVSLDITERKRAEAILEERNSQLDLLARTSERLLANREPERELLEVIFTDIARLIGMEMFYHYRANGDTRMLNLELYGGITEDERKLFATMPYGELLCGRVAEWRERIVVEDLQHSTHPGSDVLRAGGATSYAGFPLIADGELLGTIAFISRRRIYLGEGDVQLIQTICDQLATALERARLLQELRESEAKYRYTFESAGVSIWEEDWSAVKALLDDLRRQGVVDLEAHLDAQPELVQQAMGLVRICDMNQETLRMFQADSKVELSESLQRVFVPATTEIFVKQMLALSDGSDVLNWQTPLRTLTGQTLTCLFSLVLPKHDPEWRRVLVTVTDMTAQVQAELALREAQQRLQRWNVDLERAVNLKTAELIQSQERLRALATELNLAEQRERKRLAAELHDHLQQLLVLGKLKLGAHRRFNESAPAAARLIKETDEVLSEALQYTRTLAAELSPPILRDQGLSAGLQWLAESMKKRDLHVTVAVPVGDALKLPEDQAVLLFQSVRELLINSSKHAGTGQAAMRAELTDGRLCISVRDEGAGFDPAGVASAAVPSDGLSSKFGLFSIRERMSALGGSFELQSAPGKGTTATLILPTLLRSEPGSRVEGYGVRVSQGAPGAAVGTLDGPRQPNRQSPRRHGEHIRVLLVDDHAMVRQGLRAVLESYEDVQVVGEAWNGEEAVAAIGPLRPSVVVMDINMPKMNGIEATVRIKRARPETVVIGLSVNAGDNNASAMRSAGAALLLTKEAAVDELYRVMQEALSVPLSADDQDVPGRPPSIGMEP